MNIITPQIIDNLARTLARATAENLRVSPRGGNTTRDRFLPPFDVDINIDLTQLNRFVEYEPANLTITVEAGMTLASLQTTLSERGQFLPIDPPHADRATVGGVIACNAHGPLRMRYGTIRDWLIGVRVVLADGALIRGGGRVVKNVAGYDMPKLFIGAMGTLGVVGEATFKLSPLPVFTRTLVATAESAASAAGVLPSMLRMTPAPNAVEILDASTAREATGNDAASAWHVVAQFAGTRAMVERQTSDFAALCGRLGLTQTMALEGADGERLWARVRNLGVTLGGAEATVIEMRVLPSHAAEAMGSLQALANQQALDYAMFARAGQTVCAILRGDPEVIAQTIATARQWCAARRGYLVVQRLPDSLKPHVEIWGAPRADFGVMQKLKAQFDPHNILNPGVFVGGL